MGLFKTLLADVQIGNSASLDQVIDFLFQKFYLIPIPCLAFTQVLESIKISCEDLHA